jgi:hypothetical protein
MMAGGTFVAQNKVRPGAYINYIAIRNSTPIPESELGVVFLKDSQFVPTWGTSRIVITRSDLLRGGLLKKIGLTEADPNYYVFREILRNANRVYLRITGGAAASGGTGAVVAAQPGTAGNSLVVSYADGLVSTSFRGQLVDVQKATTVGTFIQNGYVKFTGAASTALSTVLASPVSLSGGTDGTLQDPQPVDQFNVMLVSEVTNDVVSLIKSYRDEEGVKVQVVAGGSGSVAPDYEGIIRLKNEYHINEAPLAALGRAYVAGLTSSSGPAQSNTYHQLPENAVISTVLPNMAIQQAIQQGYMVLSYRRSGQAVIENDINSLTTFSTDKKYEFSKNRVIRVLDTIANQVSDLFEGQYIGKVTNNEMGRSLLEGGISKILASLQLMDAIQNFDPDTDIEVLPGETIDSVVVNVYVQPLDAMEKLYMTVYVN